MPADRDVAGQRELAIRLAVDLHKGSFDNRSPVTPQNSDLLFTADSIFNYLGGPIVITLIIGPILDQSTGRPTGNTTKGSPVQLHDDEKITFSLAESDAKGFDVPDDPTSTVDDATWTLDNPSVGTLNITPDTRSCELVAGSVNSGILTVNAGGLTATVAVDIIPAGATALTVTAGEPSKQ
jgi:hypothetical protein